MKKWNKKDKTSPLPFVIMVATALIIYIWLEAIIIFTRRCWTAFDKFLSAAAKDYEERRKDMYRRHGLKA